MNCRFILPFLIAATCSLSVQAATDRWFDIEIIVFKRNVDVQKQTEQLDQENVVLAPRKRIDFFKAKYATNCTSNEPCLHKKNPVTLANSDIIRSGHRLIKLDNSALELTSEFKKLKQHQLFSPLMHVAWRMPIQNKANAIPLHLFAGENYALDLYNAGLLPTDNGSDQNLFEVDGNLLIYVEHYLHIDSQLVVRTETEKAIRIPLPEPVDNGLVIESVGEDTTAEVMAQTAIEPQQYRMQKAVTEVLFDQDRRLRSEEVHYLDHPLFGIVVQIRKIPEEELPQ